MIPYSCEDGILIQVYQILLFSWHAWTSQGQSKRVSSAFSGLPNGSLRWISIWKDDRYYPPQKFGLNYEEKLAFTLAKGHLKISHRRKTNPFIFGGAYSSLKVRKKYG